MEAFYWKKKVIMIASSILNIANYLLSTTVIELYHTPVLAIFLYMTAISATDNPPTHTDNPPTTSP